MPPDTGIQVLFGMASEGQGGSRSSIRTGNNRARRRRVRAAEVGDSQIKNLRGDSSARDRLETKKTIMYRRCVPT